MKKLFLSLVFILLGYSISRAQLPEFSMHVKLLINGDSARTIIFGYDPNASDSMVYRKETWFSNEFYGGEQNYPPAQQGDLDFRMSGFYVNRPELGIDGSDGGPIDIRKKPALDSFSLKYGLSCHVVHGTMNAQLIWNQQDIPAIIKHITLSSSFFPGKVRLDLKNVGSFVIPLKDSGEDLYANIILTLYYNKEIDQISGVSEWNIGPGQMQVYPNPITSHSTLHFTSKDDSRFFLSGYDITGKKVFEKSIEGFAGKNDIEINRSEAFPHSGVYLIRLQGTENGKPFTRSASVIVQ